MKILLISDTHGDSLKLKSEILPKYVKEVDIAIHLGDFAKDLLDLQPTYPTLTMVGVAGAFELGQAERLLTLSGKRILLTHGHKNGVKSDLSRIAYYANEKGVDACFFGHTHASTIFTAGSVLIVNPGSVTEPRGNTNASIGIVTISPDGKMSAEIVEV